MFITHAHFPTAHASKYLGQLCKHFGHKVEVSYDAMIGRAALPPGPAELFADAQGLTIRLTADDAQGLIHARFIIDSHLVTFAHREGFTGLTWTIEATGD
jgi:hypothetical protein